MVENWEYLQDSYKINSYEKLALVTMAYEALPLHAFQVALGTLSYSSSWNKPIHALQLFLFTVSLWIIQLDIQSLFVFSLAH